MEEWDCFQCYWYDRYLITPTTISINPGTGNLYICSSGDLPTGKIDVTFSEGEYFYPYWRKNKRTKKYYKLTLTGYNMIEGIERAVLFMRNPRIWVNGEYTLEILPLSNKPAHWFLLTYSGCTKSLRICGRNPGGNSFDHIISLVNTNGFRICGEKVHVANELTFNIGRNIQPIKKGEIINMCEDALARINEYSIAAIV